MEFQEDVLAIHPPSEDPIALEEALIELVKLRYFAGPTLEQAVQALGISPTTAKRRWSFAKAWPY